MPRCGLRLNPIVLVNFVAIVIDDHVVVVIANVDQLDAGSGDEVEAPPVVEDLQHAIGPQKNLPQQWVLVSDLNDDER